MIVFSWILIALMVTVILFQAALILGAPWGEYTMGGIYPGKLPARMRAAAAVQIVILLLFASIAASRAGIALAGFHNASRTGIWIVTAFFVLGTVMNLASRSRKERALMGPMNAVALVCSFLTAIS